jgi:outer membrane protein W
VRAFYVQAYADDHAVGVANEGTEAFERTEAIANNGEGLGLEGECLVTPRLGIPLTLMWVSHDSSVFIDSEAVWDSAQADLDWFGVTAGLNYHFLEPDSKVDFWGGAFIGLVALDDTTYNFDILERQTVKWDDDFAYGLQLGVQVPARRGLAFYGGLRWMAMDVEAENAGQSRDFDLNPLMWNAGLAYRF